MPSDDPLKYFRIEAHELCERIERDLLALEQGKASPGSIDALLRHAHTLKGAARVVRQPKIADHAHAIEELFGPYRSAGSVPEASVLAALFQRLDALRELVRGLDAPDEPAASAAEQGPGGNDPGTLRADVRELDALVDALGDASAELESLGRARAMLERARKLHELTERQLAAPRRGDGAGLAQALERVKDSTGEMGLELRRIERELSEGSERLERELGRAQLTAGRLRLVPAEAAFVALGRVARDAAAELGKRVRFETSGGGVRLDAKVLEVAQSALLHAVRNAVAHGIENDADRRRAGKPESGTIELRVAREGKEVVFRCSDDGRGLDTGAARRELSKKEPGCSRLSDEELLARLPGSGVSTSTGVSELAGRGIGLDVVREAAQTLAGSLRLDSRPGRGFTVELRVPFTVASLEGLAVECDDRVVLLPLAAIEKGLRVGKAELAESPHGQTLGHEGKVLPFAPLSRVLGGPARERSSRPFSALVVRSAGGAVAVGADRLLGTRSAILRPVPALAQPTRVVAGVSLDALGAPELVLDPEGVVAEVRALTHQPAEARARQRPILVIDDSLTTRILEQSILEAAGYQVELASSAEEGIDRARSGRYGLFLVDVEMPGMSGFEFVERTRSDPLLSRTPAVLVSSRSAPEDLSRGEAAGAKGYIVKDRFDQRELLSLIERLLAP